MCKACNNRLGSYVDADLVDWFDGALTMPAFASDAVAGRRRTGRILYRTTDAGDIIFVLDGTLDPAVLSMLGSGQVRVEALLRAQRARTIGLGVSNDDLIVCARKFVTASGWESRPGSHQGAR